LSSVSVRKDNPGVRGRTGLQENTQLTGHMINKTTSTGGRHKFQPAGQLHCVSKAQGTKKRIELIVNVRRRGHGKGNGDHPLKVGGCGGGAHGPQKDYVAEHKDISISHSQARYYRRSKQSAKSSSESKLKGNAVASRRGAVIRGNLRREQRRKGGRKSARLHPEMMTSTRRKNETLSR